jgi:hypothetical protein
MEKLVLCMVEENPAWGDDRAAGTLFARACGTIAFLIVTSDT